MDENDMNDRKRVEEATLPGMTEGSTVLLDGPAVEKIGEVLAKLSKGRSHPMRHRGAS